jgi:hypothetical protein
MRAQSITELECILKNEKIGFRRQMLLKQIWRMQSRLEQKSTTSNELDEHSKRAVH